MTTTDEAGLLRAVLLRPDDDLPRLVYADWLDENGEPERAEFIRVQVELATVGDCRCIPPCSSRTDYACPAHTLRERERNLLWSDAPHPSGEGWCSQWETWLGLPDPVKHFPGGHEWFRRGFVSEVRLPLAAFVGGPCDRPWGPPGTTCHKCDGTGTVEGVARRLFQSQPVTAVTLTDREPIVVAGVVARQRLAGVDDVGEPGEAYFRRWTDTLGGVNHNLPPVLFDPLAKLGKVYPGEEHLVFFPTREAALSALSDAAVRYGRELAGLTNGGER